MLNIVRYRSPGRYAALLLRAAEHGVKFRNKI